MTNLFARFVKDESGATAIEYGLIAALVSVVAIGAFTAVGTGVRDKVQTVANAINQ
jgi:pilus assembly protein Flp/PilA